MYEQINKDLELRVRNALEDKSVQSGEGLLMNDALDKAECHKTKDILSLSSKEVISVESYGDNVNNFYEGTEDKEDGELKDKSQDIDRKEEGKEIIKSVSLQRDKTVQFDYNVPMEDLLHGAFVVAEKIFIIVGNHQQSFIWNDCGFRLYVPEGALSPNETCTVAVKALIAGQFVLPENTELVSGLYAISSSRKFQAKVKIEIQHCVLLKTKAKYSNLNFIKGHQTQPGTPYHFYIQEEARFSINNDYGELWQSEFSIIGIVSKAASEDKIYHGLTLYERVFTNSWNFIFITIKHLNLHLKHVDDSFSECDKCAMFKFTFVEGDPNVCVELKLNRIINRNGWKLKPHIFPCQIAKEDIDLLGSQQPQIHSGFNPLEYSMCKVTVCAGVSASTDFHYKVPVLGIMEEKTIIIQRNLHDNSGQSSSQNMLSVSHPSFHYLSPTDHLLKVVTATVEVTKWYFLGLELKVSRDKLDKIKCEEHTVDDRKLEMLKVWLDTGEASWLSLVNALRSTLMNMNGLANKIARSKSQEATRDEEEEEQGKTEQEPEEQEGEEKTLVKRKNKIEDIPNKRRKVKGKEEEEEEDEKRRKRKRKQIGNSQNNRKKVQLEEEEEKVEEKKCIKKKGMTGNTQNKSGKGKEKAGGRLREKGHRTKNT